MSCGLMVKGNLEAYISFNEGNGTRVNVLQGGCNPIHPPYITVNSNTQWAKGINQTGFMVNSCSNMLSK